MLHRPHQAVTYSAFCSEAKNMGEYVELGSEEIHGTTQLVIKPLPENTKKSKFGGILLNDVVEIDEMRFPTFEGSHVRPKDSLVQIAQSGTIQLHIDMTKVKNPKLGDFVYAHKNGKLTNKKKKKRKKIGVINGISDYYLQIALF